MNNLQKICRKIYRTFRSSVDDICLFCKICLSYFVAVPDMTYNVFGGTLSLFEPEHLSIEPVFCATVWAV